jgi:hypothetical protein
MSHCIFNLHLLKCVALVCVYIIVIIILLIYIWDSNSIMYVFSYDTRNIYSPRPFVAHIDHQKRFLNLERHNNGLTKSGPLRFSQFSGC